MGALLRFITHFNNSNNRIKIKLGLPSEIFYEVLRASANPLKDLVSYDQVQWTSIELAQIAAYRYRLFLELHDPDYGKMFNELDLNRREDVHKFWSSFFPKKQVNQYGAEEDTLTYILRHTQLLPRQLFMILQKIIVSNNRQTGGYRLFNSDVIVRAIEEVESVIANEIFGAFSHVYPFAEMIGKAVFGNYPTIFSYDELENQWRKKARYHMSKVDSQFEMIHFSEMLIRMGIMGVVTGETERYYEGQFSYDSLTAHNTGSGNQLCLHPIFSRYFTTSGNPNHKAIMPQGVTV